MSERMLLVLGVALVCWLGARLLRRHFARRRAAALAEPAAAALAASGTPTLVYLYSSACGQCAPQARAIALLERRLPGAVAVRRLDALADAAAEEVIRRYRLWTVPATVVLDAGGRPRAVNAGLATLEQLEAQLRDASLARPA